MSLTSTSLTAALFAVACASSAYAWAVDHTFEQTHNRRMSTHSLVHRELALDSFHPEPTFETFASGIEPPVDSNARRSNDLNSTTLSFISKRLGISRNDLGFRSGYSVETDDEKFAYVQQYHEGIPFANAVANVAWKDSLVVSFGSTLVKPKTIASSKPTLLASSLIAKVEQAFDGKYNGHPPTLQYLARPDGSAALVHTIQVQNEAQGSWFAVHVDAHSGEILSATDFVAALHYRAVPLTKYAPDEGQEYFSNPEDLIASPRGWTTPGAAELTEGNNAIAYKASQTSLTSSSSRGVFDYTYNPAVGPTSGANLDAARTNAFYVYNMIHDITYRYGFTEAAFNFQRDNFGKGGQANDRVLISVQDPSGTNNAKFATPPDGQSATASMYIFTITNPNRDGSLQNDILIHEVTHGVTNRMTGGGTASCLTSTESKGLGEGWSDALANWAHQSSARVSDFVTGNWVLNNPAGVRSKPYSTSTAVNDYTYATIRDVTYIYRIGEVWANILHNVYAALVAKHGWSSRAFTNPEGREGNIVFLHQFLDALRIQPCNPTFINARDAWIQADANRYNGANRCLLWKAFASRGLGSGAANHSNNFNVPAGC